VIYYVTGLLGHGKSLYATRRMARALLSGRVVVTNVRLVDGWEHVLLKHDMRYRLASRSHRARMRFEAGTRYYFTDDFRELTGARITGFGERRGLRVFDEAHNRLNNRDWKDEEQKLMLRRLTLSRKRGWETLVVSQHAKNTDVAIRRIADAEIRVIDWQRLVRVPVVNAKLLPFHLFLAQEFPIEETATPGITRLGRSRGRELFRLGWWRNLYDTFEDYELDDERDEQTIWLPLPSPQMRAIEGGGMPAVHAERRRAAVDRATDSVELAGSGGMPALPLPPDASS